MAAQLWARSLSEPRPLRSPGARRSRTSRADTRPRPRPCPPRGHPRAADRERRAVPVALAVQHGCKAPRRMREPGQPHAPRWPSILTVSMLPVPRQHERKAVLAHAAAMTSRSAKPCSSTVASVRRTARLVAARLCEPGVRVQPGLPRSERVVSRRVQVFADGPGQPDVRSSEQRVLPPRSGSPSCHQCMTSPSCTGARRRRKCAPRPAQGP